MSTLFENIERIKAAKDDIITSLTNKGITVPEGASIEELESIFSSLIVRRPLINFTLEDEYGLYLDCVAEEGMTYGEWYFSDYATDIISESGGLFIQDMSGALGFGNEYSFELVYYGFDYAEAYNNYVYVTDLIGENESLLLIDPSNYEMW